MCRGLKLLSCRVPSQETIKEDFSFYFGAPWVQDKKLNSTVGNGTEPKTETLGPFT